MFKLNYYYYYLAIINIGHLISGPYKTIQSVSLCFEAHDMSPLNKGLCFCSVMNFKNNAEISTT